MRTGRFVDIMRGDRGGIAIMGLLFALRTASYFIGNGLQHHVLEQTGLVQLAPLFWGTAATVCGVAFVLDRPRVRAAAFALSVAVLLFWGVLFTWSHPPMLLDRGVIYIALAAVLAWAVGRGRAGEIHVKTEEVTGRGH